MPPCPASQRLFSYCPVLWNAIVNSSLITLARAGARSVMTSAAARCDLDVAVKNRLAKAKSLGPETCTSMNQARWSASR